MTRPEKPYPTALALSLVSMYALLLTAKMFFSSPEPPRVYNLCKRDFVKAAKRGSCLCGERRYCLCTPSLAADILIELEGDDGQPTHVVFIERRDGRGLAMVGGFVKVGESTEDAARREALEETGLNVTHIRQWCTFSHPERDPRRHTAALVHVARARGMPRSGDDAKGIRVVPIAELMGRPPQFAFDHGRIVAAYVARRRRSLRDKSAVGSSPGDDEHEHAYDGSCM